MSATPGLGYCAETFSSQKMKSWCCVQLQHLDFSSSQGALFKVGNTDSMALWCVRKLMEPKRGGTEQCDPCSDMLLFFHAEVRGEMEELVRCLMWTRASVILSDMGWFVSTSLTASNCVLKSHMKCSNFGMAASATLLFVTSLQSLELPSPVVHYSRNMWCIICLYL